MKCQCIRENENLFDVQMMCNLFEISRSGYYAWKQRKPSLRAIRSEKIIEKMRKIHDETRQRYGSPRMCAQLRKDGEIISRKCVARLMKQANIVVKTRRRFKATTNSKHHLRIEENHLNRTFDPVVIQRTNRYWAGDITYIDTAEGWLYLAVVLDLFSRRVIGWSMSHAIKAQLVVDALKMAYQRRKPSGDVLLFHSDRGSQYASDDARDTLEEYGIKCSMSRKGNCWDNAVIESWNGTLKTELINRQRWATREEARAEIYYFIEVWYNRERLHSSLGYRTPEEYEALHVGKTVCVESLQG